MLAAQRQLDLSAGQELLTPSTLPLVTSARRNTTSMAASTPRLGNIASDFMVHLDGGACLNQRSLMLAFDLFGRESRPSSSAALSLSELVEALSVLDLMVGHTHVSIDGTLPGDDRAAVASAADDFSATTGWSRDELREAIPQSKELQLFMHVDAADRALDLLHGPVPGLDSSLNAAAASTFFTELEQAIKLSKQRGDESSQEALITLADRGFRGSKCVAGLMGLGVESARKALTLRDTHKSDQGLAASMLINRFRFGYLRHLARNAGDVYVPGSVWRRFSVDNARSTYEALAQHLDTNYLPQADIALGGADRELSGVLPPIGLYCLVAAKPAHGPRAVIDVARQVAADYRRLLGHLNSTSNEVSATHQRWTELTGDSGLDLLSEIMEKALTDELGKVDRKVVAARQRGPSATSRYLTSVSGIPGQGVSAVVSDAAKGAVSGALTGATALAVAGSLGAFVGGLVGAAAGVAVELAGKGIYKGAKSYLYGHVDAYRALDSYLTHPEVASIHMPGLERAARQVLGRRLIGS